jgi:hypothetical protein
MAARDEIFQHVSPTLDTDLDRNQLEPLLEKRYKAITEGKPTTEIDEKIAVALKPELIRRWNKTKEAYLLIKQDDRPDNPGTAELAIDGIRNYVGKFQRIEKKMDDPSLGPAFTPHPETDFHGSAAASAYFLAELAESKYISTLIHDDTELQMEAIQSGNAFFAKVLHVRDEGSGRKTMPVWKLRVEAVDGLRLRSKERYSPIGSKKHTIQARDVDFLDNKVVEFEGDWIQYKTVPLSSPIEASLTDPRWVGNTVLLVPGDSSGLARMSSEAVWKAKSGPGAWLTHGTPPQPFEQGLVDDVTQLSEIAQ